MSNNDFFEGRDCPDDLPEDLKKRICNSNGKIAAVGYIFDPQKGFYFFKPKENCADPQKISPVLIHRILKRYQEIFLSEKDKEADSVHCENADIGILSSDNGDYKSSGILDIILQLVKFYRENKNFFISESCFGAGHSLIDWKKTIQRSQPIIQEIGPVYMNPVCKVKRINSSEKLLSMFFSILNYLHCKYPDLVEPCVCWYNISILPVEIIDSYLVNDGKDNLGMGYMRAIRSRYFSDKSRALWSLCNAFFEKNARIRTPGTGVDYFLSTKFDRVFEKMVDAIFSDREEKEKAQEELKKHGRQLDHLYCGVHPLESKLTGYFISDSKYYADDKIDEKSIFKQFDYSRHLLQAIFANNKKYKIYSEKSDSFLPIINCFIVPRPLSNPAELLDKNVNLGTLEESLFPERLFDRETRHIMSLKINFETLAEYYLMPKVQLKSISADLRKQVSEFYKEMIEERYERKSKSDLGDDTKGKIFEVDVDGSTIQLCYDLKPS